MISVKDAKNLIRVGTNQLDEIIIDLVDSVGFAVSRDIFAPIDFPDFEQSAMDGYGIFIERDHFQCKYRLTGEEQAGNIQVVNSIQPGEAIRIFTGSKIPQGVNAVIQQEWVEKTEDGILIKGGVGSVGLNIRKIGSQNKKGDLLLSAGSSLSPAAVSFLAGFGFNTVPVIRKPKVVIINTGKELICPGKEKQPGQVYESNSYALQQVLKCMHIQPKEIFWVDDDKMELSEKIAEALSHCDLLLITGGVSVGDYDFVVDALTENDVQQIFHQIKQKPGKPLYFGKHSEKMVFGLPGNPASVLTCFFQYVYPCLRKMMGFFQEELLQLYLPSLTAYEKKAGMTHFLKGSIRNSTVEILGHQESYKMNSFGISNALIEIEEEKTIVQMNEVVKIYILSV